MQGVELTPRERDILMLLCDGLTNREIADKLYIAESTVKWYNTAIFSKLDVSNRVQATMKARELALYPPAAPPAADPAPRVLHNLPNQLTSFIGRTHDVRELQSLLAGSRLVTLTGAGGVGKTRLAQEFARSQIDKFPQGVYFVSLADAKNADSIIFAVAETLGFQFQRGSEPLSQLLDHLQKRTMLFIFDNFEHLVGSNNVVAQLLTATEAISIIITSREPLNLYGETIYPVRGLSLQDSAGEEKISNPSEATQLFVSRARSIHPSFETSPRTHQSISHICQLVEGMPLAIELAATWVDTLQLPEIAEEITLNLDFLQSEIHNPRHGHNSIRATFLRSWVLLDEHQKEAFRRIAVFRGGFNREAAQAVAGIHYGTLKALVMKSLLHFDPDHGRYELHQLLHQFAYEKLEEIDEAQSMRVRHAEYFSVLADEQWQAIKGEHQYAALNKIEADIENIRFAWDYWTLTKNTAQLKILLHAIWVIYDVHAWYPAGVRLFQETIDALQSLTTVEAKVSVGWLTAVQGMFVAARQLTSRESYELCYRGVSILRQLNQQEYLLVPLLGLFKSAVQVNESAIALECAEECLEIATEIDDMWGVSNAKHLLALMAIDERDYELARELAHSALDICKALSNYRSESMLCIEVLATIAIHQKQYEQARQWLKQGIEAATSIRYVQAMRAAYFQLGYVAVLSNNYSEAATHWNKALAISDQLSLITTGFLGKEIMGDYPVIS